MTDDLDFPQLQAACFRAICRHQVSELEQLVAITVIRLSFGIGEPCLRLDSGVEMSRLAGISKGKAADVVKRLVRARALEVSGGGTLYTFLPPSKAWPWLFAERMDARLADAVEADVVRANRGGPRQGEFLPEPGREFEEAMAIERMRASLMEHHRAAGASAGYAGHTIPVMDRLPKPAPSREGLSSGEGHTRPLGTAEMVASLPADSLPEMAACREVSAPAAELDDGTRKGNLVPESGTRLLRGLRVSEVPKAFNSLKAFKSEERFPNREPLGFIDPGAKEDELLAWMRHALGADVMRVHGGGWRQAIRTSRYAVLNACQELTLRMRDSHLKPLRNPGGWLRDSYHKILKEREEMNAATNATETP